MKTDVESVFVSKRADVADVMRANTEKASATLLLTVVPVAVHLNQPSPTFVIVAVVDEPIVPKTPLFKSKFAKKLLPNGDVPPVICRKLLVFFLA